MARSPSDMSAGTGIKKAILLSAPPKPDAKTFCFDLELFEPTAQSCPEFSWNQLIKGRKEMNDQQHVAAGGTALDPYASDDEEDLKAMAARFEAKYGQAKIPKKRNRVQEDFLDKGAGYDETDSFIDNTDVYDEVVPHVLDTVQGGFYINSGSLDFKDVQMSEDDEGDDNLASDDSPTKKKRGRKPKANGSPPTLEPGMSQNPSVLKMQKLKINRKKVSEKSPDGKHKDNPANAATKPNKIIKLNQGSKDKEPKVGSGSSKQSISVKKPVRVIQSSSSSSSSSSSGSSSSSDSSDDSSSSSETPEKEAGINVQSVSVPEKKVKIKNHESISNKQFSKQFKQQTNPLPLLKSQAEITVAPQKKLKTKNVPLNPALHKDKVSGSGQCSNAILPQDSLNVSAKVKELFSTPPVENVQLKTSSANVIPRTESPSAISIAHSTPPATIIKIPTPTPTLKITPIPSPSPISAHNNAVSSSKLSITSNMLKDSMAVSFTGSSAPSKGEHNKLNKKLAKARAPKNLSTSRKTSQDFELFSALCGINQSRGRMIGIDEALLSQLSSQVSALTHPYRLTPAAMPCNSNNFEMPKLRPAHLSSNLKALSNSANAIPQLGSGITVTEVSHKKSINSSISFHHKSPKVHSAATSNNNLGIGSTVSHANKYPNTVTITPSSSPSLLNLSSHGITSTSGPTVNPTSSARGIVITPRAPTPVAQKHITSYDVSALLGKSDSPSSSHTSGVDKNHVRK